MTTWPVGSEVVVQPPGGDSVGAGKGGEREKRKERKERRETEGKEIKKESKRCD